MFGLFIGIILVIAFVLVPLFMIQARQKIKEMQKKIEVFDSKTFSSAEEKDREKRKVKNELIKIKAGIMVDKQSIAKAKDILDSF